MCTTMILLPGLSLVSASLRTCTCSQVKVKDIIWLCYRVMYCSLYFMPMSKCLLVFCGR